MRRFCSFVCAIAVCCSVLTPAIAEEKEKLRSGSVRVDLDGASIELLEARAVAVVPDPGCRVIGDFLRDIPMGSSRYRGNVYRIDSPVDLVQVQVELAFDVVPDSIVVSIHQKQANSSWTRYPPEDSEAIDSDLQVFVVDAPGFGNPTF
ncbi:MAG: hypothetical protein IIB59_02955, partial [Planctomycetes bacterium]|nr:hypothetical protein [Planctomycetota bacterium]